MRRSPARSGTVLLPFLLLLAPAARAAVPAPGPFDAELGERRAALKRLEGRPEAIVPLLGILDLWTTVDDRAAIAAALDEVIADRAQRPDVRARAAYLRSIAADRMGDHARAASLRDGLGLLTAWQVLGPFDNEGKGGHAQAFPVEKDLAGPIDPAREYQGVGALKSLRWRPLPSEMVTQGVVALDAALRPETNVTGYATTFVHSDAPADVAVRVGSSGAIKVWVNGRLALDRDVYRPLRIDQDAAAAHLEKGWNRIVVKLGTAEGPWAFFLRLTARDGGPIKLASSAASQAAPSAVKAAGAGPKLDDLGADLRRAAANPKSAEAARALGLYLYYVAPDDPEARGAETELSRAAKLAPSSEALRLLAMATAEPNERRKRLEEALALADRASPVEKARVLTELGDAYLRVHRDRRAEELWRRALEADPDFFPATVKLAELCGDRGLPARGVAMLADVEKRHPSLAVVKAAANLADRRGYHDEAERRYGLLHAATVDDLGVLRELFSLARSRGDLDGALKLLDQMAQARPDLFGTQVDRADLLDGVGRTDEAHAVLHKALAELPDEPRLLEKDGRLLHRLGRDVEALAEFRRALELRPQNPELRAYVREVETRGGKPAAADDLARRYTEAVPAVIARAAKVPVTGKDSARVLLDRTAIRVHPNGLSETFTQRVVEILDDRGARDNGATDIRYTPDTQSIEVRAARVYKKNGEIVEAATQADRDVSEPWYGLYYDVRAELLEFPHLEPGDVVDVEYTVSDVGRRNLLADYFGDVHVLQEDVPRLESDYVLIAPKARPLYFNQPRLATLAVDKHEQGDDIVYSFHATAVPKIESEPGMPGFTEVAAYIHVSTYKSWEDVAAWYTGLVREQLVADDAIRAAAKEAVAGITDERQKIRAIYDHVVKHTRYVGLEFGIHGYKPYKVSQIYARKFGDCKDKASLLVTMLREIHVDATLVLARTRRGGDLDAYPASLAPFDHAIVYVPKYDLFLDGTAEFSGSDELPAQDQDIPVLLVSDPRVGGKGRLTRTPVLAAENNHVTRDLRVALAPTGAAKVDLRMTVAGQAASEWRSHYQTAGERLERFEKAENGAHPGARVTKVDFPTIDDLERPVELSAHLEAPAWARSTGSDLAMPAVGREGELLRSYARLSERTNDLVIGYPWIQEDHVAIALPKGWAPRRLPETRHIETPFGSFAVSVGRKGQEVEVSTALKMNRHRIGRADYAAFRKFCLDVDAAMGQELVLTHE